MRIAPFLLALFTCSLLPAIAPGTAQGQLKVDGQQIALTVAKAHLFDNAEGAPGDPRELRILLADRDTPPGALDGMSFLPVDRLARDGKVRGLLIKLDPKETGRAFVTILRQGEPGAPPMTQVLLQGENPVFKQFRLEGNQVSGEIRWEPEPDEAALVYAVTFAAPVEPEPAVTADLKGAAALASPQVEALKAYGQVLAKGDFKAARTCLSAAKAQEIDAFMAQAGGAAMLSQMAAATARALPEAARVVVRGRRAVILWPNGGRSVRLVQEAGRWLLD